MKAATTTWQEQCVDGCEKTWAGDDPKCAFREGGYEEDWNCGLVGKLRQIIQAARDSEATISGIAEQYCDDYRYATINISEVYIAGVTLWMAWYKNRGRTDAIWILDGHAAPCLPTPDDIRRVVAFYAPAIKDWV